VTGIPSISFDHKFILIATKKNGHKSYYASLQDYNNKILPQDRLNGVDYNEFREEKASTGLKGMMDINFDIYETDIKSVEIYMFLDYKFSEIVDIKFTDMVKIENNM
jgi:Transmembrane protein 231